MDQVDKVDGVDRDAVMKAVGEVLEELGVMLRAKNAAYGNSALSPVRVFSGVGVEEGLNVRMDDKLSRIRNGGGGEDAEWDLLGYLVLKRAWGKQCDARSAGPEVAKEEGAED